MNKRTKTGLEILQASVLIGVLGNLLLRQTPWGLNAFLFVSVFVAVLLVLMWRRRPELLTRNTIALTAAMVFFASMFLIRDSIELRVYDTFAILIIMGVLLLVNFEIKANIAGAFHYSVAFVWSGLTSLFGPFLLLGADIDWREMPGNKISRNAFAVLRGLAIALPLVLIFGALFMAADAVFEGFVNRAINFDIKTIISHVVLTSLFAWLTAGYFRGALSATLANVGATVAGAATPASTSAPTSAHASVADREEAPTSFVAKVAAEPGDEPTTLPDSASIVEHINRSDPPNTTENGSQAEAETSSASPTEPKSKKRDWQNFDSSVLPSVFTLGSVETIIILGLLDLLFLSFVIFQVPYLFGGMDLVQNTPDFKLAEYARRGFGELVAVAALVLPMLLVSHWLLRRETGGPEQLFRILAGVQIGLLFVIMASAVQRLVLLTGELGYGLTTVRFYPMVVMTWLAVVFVWFLLTIFRGAREHFAWGALWSAIVILGLTNLVNPDALIVQTNLHLASRGRVFDARYNSRLSDDAVPTLLEGMSVLSATDKCHVAKYLNSRLYDPEKRGGDLRSWNLSRSVAQEDMSGNMGVAAENGLAEVCAAETPAPLTPVE